MDKFSDIVIEYLDNKIRNGHYQKQYEKSTGIRSSQVIAFLDLLIESDCIDVIKLKKYIERQKND